MLENLEACLRQGASPQDIESLFPRGEGGPELEAGAMLRIQTRVRAMLREGVSPELVLDKVREGTVKGVAAPTLERVVDKMEGDVRSAHRYLNRIQAEDGSGEVDAQRRQMLERHLSLDMWGGLEEGDLDQLRSRARLRDGSCDPSDLVSAADVVAVAQERGMHRDEALGLAGDALEAGYTHREMRTLGAMVAAAKLGEFGDRLREHLHDGMGQHRDFGEMAREMMSWGWMGPADVDGGGGWHGMMDDWLGGGPADHGRMRGGQDSDGGGSGGGMGGQGGTGGGQGGTSGH
jgi:hypothetical protein